MWKWFILLWLAQWRTILSQPVISENVRETRQLNFGDCCPCPEYPENAAYDVMKVASTDDRCPCRATPDSESAPSIFTPVMQAVDPFIRSEAKTPKPLLKPEVGLASSVLETLQEVTDQEYQEALVRDATRTVLNDREENLFEQEMNINTPRNIVNIILQPKDAHTLDDVIPEASHTQDTRCVHPLIGRTNSLDEMKVKPKNNVFRKVFPTSTLKNSRAYNDMANSASNIQEHKMPPLKSNILEDLKLKSDLLKMKLFSNNKNSLKDTFSNANKQNQIDRQSTGDSTNDKYAKRVSNYKLGSLLEYLKTSKQKNHPPTDMKETEKEIEEVSFSPSNVQNNYLRNNERLGYVPKNAKSQKNTEDLIKTKYNLHSKEMDLSDKFIETQKDALSEQSRQWIPLSDANLKKDYNVVINDFEKNECDVNLSKEKNFKETTHSKSTENMDAQSSPTELNTQIITKPIDEISEKAKENNGKYLSMALNNNEENQANIKENILDDIEIPRNKDNNEFNAENVVTDDREIISNDEKSCDAEKAISNDIREIIDIPQIMDKESSIDNVDNFGVQENQVSNNAQLSQTTSDYDIFKSNKINTLSNIKADVLKTLQNFKTANEKIQDKLKLNVQNISKLNVINNNPLTDIQSNSLRKLKNCTDENSYKMSNSLNTQDLQEMSDRILNLSLTNDKSVESLKPDSTVAKNSDTNVVKNTDNEMTPSESNIVTSTNTLFEIKEPTHSSSDSLLKSSAEIADVLDSVNSVDNKQETGNNRVIDYVSAQNPCENVTPITPDKIKESSSNDQDKEMMSEGSSPFENRIRQNSQDFIVQPESNLNVEGFLDNLKSSLSDFFNNNENRKGNSHSSNDNANLNRNSLYLEKNYQNNLNESPLPLNERRNIDTVNSYVPTRTRGDLSNWDKNNYPINRLNSYKSKVAIPESLNLKTIPLLLNKNKDTLQRPFQDDPEVMSASSIFRSPIEIPSSPSLRIPPKNAKQDYDSDFNLKKAFKTQNILTPTETSKNLKSRTEDALRNIKESFNSLRKAHMTNQNNILGKPHARQNILRPNDLDKKVQQFNSDLKDRISLMSQRIPDIFSFDDKAQAKNKIKNLNNKIKNNSKYKHQVKNNDLLKSNTNFAFKTPSSILSSSKKSDIPKSHLQQKMRQFKDPIQSSQKFDTKSPTRKEMRHKTLNENKVTISFTTPRPVFQEMKRPTQKIYNKLTPTTLRSLINLPKSTSYRTPLQKSLDLKSKLKSEELKSSASNQFTSQIASPESMILQPVSDSFDENTDPKNVLSVNDPGRYESENVFLSKMRDANKFNDAKALASNYINKSSPSFTDKSLKENVSYKCKMICFEDDADFK